MEKYRDLHNSKYGHSNDFIEIIPREIGIELSIEICRVVNSFTSKCVNVIINGDEVTITYDDKGEHCTIHCSI